MNVISNYCAPILSTIGKYRPYLSSFVSQIEIGQRLVIQVVNLLYCKNLNLGWIV